MYFTINYNIHVKPILFQLEYTPPEKKTCACVRVYMPLRPYPTLDK